MKNSFSFYLIVLISLNVFLVKISDKNFGNKGNYGLIDWDNFGYYLYLPAVFIYDDLKVHDDTWVLEAQKKYNLSTNLYQAHYLEGNGNRVIQYTSGMAFLYSPAFFVGHTIAKITDYSADGFSKPYQIALLIQSFLIVFLGLFYLRKLSLTFFSEKLTCILLVIIALGTNYFQIASANISSPHVYLFTLYALILYYNTLWHKDPQLKYAFIIGIFSSIMILSRPNELLFLLVLLLWRSGQFSTIKSKINFLFKHKTQLGALLVPLLVFGLVQPLYWHYVTGEWMYDSYRNEDFKLLNPYLSEYLFSYKKGWLLYTPIMVLGLLGFVPFIKKRPKIGLALGVFMLLNIWVLSSWDCWWYADSFSQRSIVQSYPVFILPFGYLLSTVYEKYRGLLYTTTLIFVGLVGLNLFQTYQFAKYILHPNSMTKEYYWNVFGVVDIYAPDRTLLDMDRSINYLPEEPIKKHKLIHYEDFNSQSDNTFELNGYRFKEEGTLWLTPEKPISDPVRFAYRDIADSSFCYVICRMRFKSEFDAKANPFGIEFSNVDSYSNKKYDYRYRGVKNISWFEKGSWSSMDLVVIPAYLRNEDDSIQINLKLFGSKPVQIDNLSIEVLDPSTNPELESEQFITDYYTLELGDWSNSTMLLEGKGMELIDTNHQYSSTFSTSIADLGEKRNITLQANVNLQHNYSSTNAVVSIDKAGKSLFYKSYPLIRGKDGWENVSLQYDLPKEIDPEATLKAYLWNKTKNKTLIRNLQVITR